MMCYTGICRNEDKYSGECGRYNKDTCYLNQLENMENEEEEENE